MSTSAPQPAFASSALGEGRFDYGDVILMSLPPTAPSDPRLWAETIFSVKAMPWWVNALMGLRAALVPLIGLRSAPEGVFDVTEVVGDEALMVFDDDHLEFRCAVGVDRGAGLVRLTTVVRLHGWRGQVYFTPVSLLHPLVVNAMLRRTRRLLTSSR